MKDIRRKDAESQRKSRKRVFADMIEIPLTVHANESLEGTGFSLRLRGSCGAALNGSMRRLARLQLSGP